MSHDLWAAFATAEIARHFNATPANCYAVPPAIPTLSAYAAGGSRSFWPHEDGVVVLEHPAATHNVAMEFKRQNEGLHGILTALGQSLAYIDKGYDGSVLILPENYSSHSSPGQYISKVISDTIAHPGVGVFTYSDPDSSKSKPFEGKLTLRKPLQIDVRPRPAGISAPGTTQTQWMHVREGSSTPSAFFRYLQTAKFVSAGERLPTPLIIPIELVDAVHRIRPAADAVRYLSNTVPGGAALHDAIWRQFWFDQIVTAEVMQIWTKVGLLYAVNDAATRLLQADGVSPMKFFCERVDSIKRTIVASLNSGAISEETAWELFAINIRSRAHSYREDIDSGLAGLGLLEGDGRPSDLGYRFVDAVERNGNPHVGTPRSILMAALLKNGDLGALLHYIYKLSEERFRSDPMSFVIANKFVQNDYLNWLENELENNLHVIRKVALRGGKARKPLQAELSILRKFDLARKFRIGVGLEINWPALQDGMAFPI